MSVLRNAASVLLILMLTNSIVTQTVRAQADAEGQDAAGSIVASYLDAIGGLEAHKKHTTRKTEGTVTLHMGPNMPPFGFAMTQKAPNLAYTEINIPGHGTIIEGNDGQTAWKKDPGKPARQLRGGELRQKQRDALFYGYVDLDTRFETLTLEEQKTVDGRPCDVLTGTGADGWGETLCFDAETHLLIRVERPDASIDIGEYKELGGLQLAHSISVSRAEQKIFSVKLGSIMHGVDLGDTVFSMPRDGETKRAGRGKGRGRRLSEGSIGATVWTDIGGFDANSNGVVDEAEVESGFLSLVDQQNESYAKLLAMFDKDKDKTLNAEEGQAARTFVFSILSLLQHDLDGNWKADDPELDQAWETLVEEREKRNARLLKRYDKNRNGTIDADEAENVRRELGGRQP